jgi:1-deoxy-D-xylulose-5-phosphate synthase
MATQGMVVYAILTFYKEHTDQIIHDVAFKTFQHFFVWTERLVGRWVTHHGFFDLAYLRCIPNMIIHAPIDKHKIFYILLN